MAIKRRNVVLVLAVFAVLIAVAYRLGIYVSARAYARDINQIQTEQIYDKLTVYASIDSYLKRGCIDSAKTELGFLVRGQKSLLHDLASRSRDSRRYIRARDRKIYDEVINFKQGWKNGVTIPACQEAGK